MKTLREHLRSEVEVTVTLDGAEADVAAELCRGWLKDLELPEDCAEAKKVILEKME